MAMTNRAAYLVGIPTRVCTRISGRLRDGRRKTAIKGPGKRGIGSPPILKVKEERDYMGQTRVGRHLRSRASLGGVHPSLETHHTGASRSLHSHRQGLTCLPLEPFTLRVGYLA